MTIQKQSIDWKNSICMKINKDDIPEDIWNMICKIRNRSIQLVRDIEVADLYCGEAFVCRYTIPKGSLGYVVDFPEEFLLSEHDKALMGDPKNESGIPVIFCRNDIGEIPGVDFLPSEFNVFFLTKDDFEITHPFCDPSLFAIAWKCIREPGNAKELKYVSDDSFASFYSKFKSLVNR